MAGILNGKILVYKLPPEDNRTLDVWFYVKALVALGVVTGAAREPVGALWNRLRPRRNPPV